MSKSFYNYTLIIVIKKHTMSSMSALTVLTGGVLLSL